LNFLSNTLPFFSLTGQRPSAGAGCSPGMQSHPWATKVELPLKHSGIFSLAGQRPSAGAGCSPDVRSRVCIFWFDVCCLQNSFLHVWARSEIVLCNRSKIGCANPLASIFPRVSLAMSGSFSHH